MSCTETELEAVVAINSAIRRGVATETVEQLLNAVAQLPLVYQTAANLYQAELFSLQLQGGRVSIFSVGPHTFC